MTQLEKIVEILKETTPRDKQYNDTQGWTGSDSNDLHNFNELLKRNEQAESWKYSEGNY